MAGHSHSKNIAVRKGKQDSSRAKLFSKLSRYIIIAARSGGGDPDTNLKLVYAIAKARAVSMPRDNIERAIKRGTGEAGGEIMEELTYEGYGPGGVAIFCDCLTDNRNRTGGEVAKLFDKSGGNMGKPGCVGYLFDRKGVFVVDAKATDEDSLMAIILDAGADDLKLEGDHFEIICDVTIFKAVSEALAKAHLTPVSAEIAMIPKTRVEVDVEMGKRIIRLMDAMDDHDDVQNVYSNAHLTAEMYGE